MENIKNVKPDEHAIHLQFWRIDAVKSPSARVAILITDIFGTLKFLAFCVAAMTLWIVWNMGLIPYARQFDPYPFPALETVVSIFAIFLSVSVLISQRRQGEIEKKRQRLEFEVNIHAEKEITKVLEMLHGIQKKLGISHPDDKELEDMKNSLDLDTLHQKIDKEIV